MCECALDDDDDDDDDVDEDCDDIIVEESLSPPLGCVMVRHRSMAK